MVEDDDDRRHFLQILGDVVARFRWRLYQYVLMTNHFHFVIGLIEQTLSEGMMSLNSRYAATFNRRHRRVGHLFQGRFHSRLVQEEDYLRQVIRYDALNPVRAGLAARPEDYEWSGHNAIAGLCEAPPWLDVRATLECFAPDPTIARTYYTRFVDEGMGVVRSPWKDLVGQIYLGDPQWVESLQHKVEGELRSDNFPVPQKEPITMTMANVIEVVAKRLSVKENDVRFGHGGLARMLAAWVAWNGPRLPLRSIAASLRVRSLSGVSRMVRTCEAKLGEDQTLQTWARECMATLRHV
ncbi:MAG TPA: transposase [Thermoanaerobaculia bacterium]|nr:transposase [Thermoanaerobaculia bacterium]